MINPVTVMRMLGERKAFLDNHPEFFAFILKSFGEEMEPGTVIELQITKPGEKTISSRVNVMDTDMRLLDGVREVLR